MGCLASILAPRDCSFFFLQGSFTNRWKLRGLATDFLSPSNKADNINSECKTRRRKLGQKTSESYVIDNHKQNDFPTLLRCKNKRFLIYLLFFIIYVCVIVTIYAHVRVGTHGSQKRVSSALSWSCRQLWTTWCGYRYLNSSPSGEQYTLLTTELSLQSS